MKHVLIGVDGSTAAHRAAQLGAEIARRFGARITLAYVVPRLVLPPDAYGLTVAEVESEHQGHAEEVLRLAREAVGDGPDLATEVRSGPPAESLAEAAAEREADLLVVGSRGKGAVARMLLGSTCDRLVHVSSKPVLVVH